MSTQVAPFTVVFPDWYDDRAEFEFTAKGYLPDVEVRLDDGSRYRLFFYDPVRLSQDLDEEALNDKPYRAEPGLVVVPEISRDGIQKAVAGLWHDGFFKHLKRIE
jgi:hypothetical protein